MSGSLIRRLVAALAATISIAASAAQAHLGFGVSAETDGFFSTTLKQVKITEVAAGGPADQAGLLVGDDVESVNDIPIAGTKGTRITDVVHAVQPGEHIKLMIHRGDGVHVIDIVGGAPK